MIITGENSLLYIEPSARVSRHPLIDRYTRKMTAAFKQAREGPRYRSLSITGTQDLQKPETVTPQKDIERGWHTCACGAPSSNCDYFLPNGMQTNSLAVHYLAWHRDDVPQVELDKVNGLPYGEAEPDQKLLAPPRSASTLDVLNLRQSK